MIPLSSKLISFWDSEKNFPVTVDTVSAGSNKNLWWKCDLGHEWEAKPNSLKRTSQCPVCSGAKVLAGFNDLTTTHPDVAKEWHFEKNEVLPTSFTYGSKTKVWWLGKDCNHKWEATIGSRAVSGQGCAVCRGLQVQVKVNDLATTHPDVAKEWHPTKNGQLLPSEITAGSNKKVWWLGSCGHEWQVSPLLRSKGNKCYQCLGRKKSERQPLLSTMSLFEELHPSLNSGLDKAKLTTKSNLTVWWLGQCGHSWQAKIVSRTAGQGCAICHGSQIETGVNDLATLKPELAKEWHLTKNELAPTDVTLKSHYKAWWQCSKGHEWYTKVQTRTVGHGCPSCDASTYVSKAEKEIADFVTGLGFDVRTSVRNLIKGELDIFLPEKNVAIEFNGLYWHSEAGGKDKNYHYDKWRQCKEQGIQLIQIWEDEWNRNPELVKRMVTHKLGVTVNGKVFARKTKFVALPEVSVIQEFLVKNHLQGYRTAKYFGLKDESENLVAVLGVQKKGENGLEIIRFATTTSVPGGFTKLLTHMLKQPEYVHATKVLSYSHNDYSDGGVYEANGFMLEHAGSPGYSYWKSGWPARQNRLKYSPSAVQRNPELEFKEGFSERELATLNKLIRVWDSGSSLWVKKLT